MPNRKRAAHRVLLLVYEGFELLDLAGTASVFTNATSVLAQLKKETAPGYQVLTLSAPGGFVQAQGGVCVATQKLSEIRFSATDTVLVVGGRPQSVDKASEDVELLRCLKRASRKARRVGSICTGAFILAASGLAQGRRLATHWNAVQRLRQRFHDIEVCETNLYVEDHELWSSAGVTAGIDMALAMVERDHKRSIMGEVARQLVVYAKRPGYQSQFSSILATQTRVCEQYDELTRWLNESLDQPIKVEHMAKQMKMSKRTFCRNFKSNTGLTPAAYFLRLRLERARELLASGQAVKSVFMEVGFCSEAGFRRAFELHFGVAPSMHRHAQAS